MPAYVQYVSMLSVSFCVLQQFYANINGTLFIFITSTVTYGQWTCLQYVCMPLLRIQQSGSTGVTC